MKPAAVLLGHFGVKSHWREDPGALETKRCWKNKENHITEPTGESNLLVFKHQVKNTSLSWCTTVLTGVPSKDPRHIGGNQSFPSSLGPPGDTHNNLSQLVMLAAFHLADTALPWVFGPPNQKNYIHQMEKFSFPPALFWDSNNPWHPVSIYLFFIHRWECLIKCRHS